MKQKRKLLLDLREKFIILVRRISHRQMIDQLSMLEGELREMRVVEGADR